MVEVAGNKEFGSLFLQQGAGKQENVALEVVQNGWAKVCCCVSERGAGRQGSMGHGASKARQWVGSWYCQQDSRVLITEGCLCEPASSN